MAEGDAPTGFGAFLKSALRAATTDVVGIEPDWQTQLFRAANPTGSLISQLGGFAVPMAGFTAAASKIPAMSRALGAVGAEKRLAASPFVARGQLEALRFAPFEAGRTFASAIIGDHTDEIATEAVINLGAAFGIGGVIGKIRGSQRPELGPEKGRMEVGRLSELIPEFNPTASPQERLAALRQAMILNPENAEIYGKGIKSITDEALLQSPTKAGEYTGMINGDKDATRTVSRLFVPETESEIHIRKLHVGTHGFASEGARKQFTTEAGIGDLTDLAQHSMFPRVITGSTEAAAKHLDGAFRSGFWNRADDWMYVKEEGKENMVVMARKVKGTDEAKAGDQYLILKTPNPELRTPRVAEGVKNLRALWQRLYPEKDIQEMDVIFGDNYYYKLARQYEAIYGGDVATKTFAGLPREQVQNTFMALAKKLGDTNLGQKIQTVIPDPFGRIKQIVSEYLAPTEFQAASPRARALFGMAKHLEHSAHARAAQIFYGSTKGLPTPWAHVANVPQRGGLDATLETLRGDKAAFGDFYSGFIRRLGPVEAEAAGLHPKAVSALAKLKETDGPLMDELAQAYGIAGKEGGYKPLKHHLELSRTWPGEHRAEIVGEGGLRYAVVGGRSVKEAAAVRDALIKDMNDQGLNAVKGAEWSSSNRLQDLQDAAMITQDKRIAGAIDEAYARTIRRAYDPTVKDATFKPVTLDEVKKVIKEHVETTQRRQAELVFDARSEEQAMKLGLENPAVARNMNEKINAVWGHSGPLTKAMNTYSDKHLSRFFGGESATKIARTVTLVNRHLALGFGNISHPVLNAMNVLTTIPGEISFIKTARDVTKNRYYDVLAAVGADGLPIGTVALPSVPRIMRESFRTLGKKLSADENLMWQRASREGVTDPRVAEDTVGATSRTAGNLRGLLKGEQNFGEWVGAVSDFLPATTDKFARVYAFNVGLTMAEMIGLKDSEKIYMLASRFVERTMYNTAAGDRAKLMTGPIGSMTGQFKNWMMHYIGNWMVYAGEGIAANKWKPLLWTTGTAWATGGVLGAGPSSLLVDAAERVFSDKPTVEGLYDWFGGRGVAADAAMYGLPGLFGLSLIQSGSAPGSEIMRDIGFMFNMASWDRAKAAGKAIGNAWGSFQANGDHPVTGPLVKENLMRAFAPRSIFRGMSLFEDGEIRSLGTGNPIIKDSSFLQRTLYTMGLNPIEVENTMHLSRELWQDNAALKNRIAWMGRRWNEAEIAGDSREMNRIMAVGTGLGIFDRVLRSAKTREAREERDIISSTSKDPGIPERRQNLGIPVQGE